MKFTIKDTPFGACLKIEDENGNELSLAFRDYGKPSHYTHFRDSKDQSGDPNAIELNGEQWEGHSFQTAIQEFLLNNQ